jgi:hypothetical protein
MRDNSNRPEPADARPAEAGTPNRAPADASVARSRATIRLEEWRSELLRAAGRAVTQPYRVTAHGKHPPAFARALGP